MGAKTPLSLEEFMALPDDGNKHALNQGELVVVPIPKSEHSLIVQRINRILSVYAYEAGIGGVLTGAGYLLKCDPEVTLRQADVSFLSASRVKATPGDEYFAGSPELAVEVMSEGDKAEAVEIKVDQYMAAGGKQVWVVYPLTRTVLIHLPGGRGRRLHDCDTITSDLFPGWSARVADFFDLDY